MSYLPRMSKTYKEPPMPEPLPLDQLENSDSSSILKPASSLLNEKTYNPLLVLKHYKYLPHKPPVLPGPSVAEEAAENELFREAIRLSLPSKLEDISSSGRLDLDAPIDNESETSIIEDKLLENATHRSTRSSSRKSSKGNKMRISNKKQTMSFTEKKRGSSGKLDNCAVSMFLVEDDILSPYLKAQSIGQTSVEESVEKEKKNFKRNKFFSKDTNNIQGTSKKLSPSKSIKTVNQNIQCSLFETTEKTYVIPPGINALLRTLAFLLYEINKNEVTSLLSEEGKNLMTHVQLQLGDLCNKEESKDFGFDVSYSDSKRMEKVYEDLQKYLKTVYGEKGEIVDNFEILKKMFIQLQMKELELELLKDKLQDKEEIYITDVKISENEFKNPEVSYQNRTLENEQLIAEKEFSNIELRKCQKAIAEMEWEIKSYHEQITELRRVSSSKSKTDISRSISSLKFPGDVGLPPKINFSKESEKSLRRK